MRHTYRLFSSLCRGHLETMATSDLSDLKPVYLIHGSEDLLLEQAVSRLKRRFADIADMDFNLDVFDGEIADVDEVVTASNTLPFMSERRLVIVRKADRMPIEGLHVLADYAADPNPNTTLVLVASKIAKNLRIYKAIDAFGGVAEYKAPAKREYPRAVVEMFTERGKRIDLDAAEVLVRTVGHDLRRLSIETDKIVSYMGDTGDAGVAFSRHDIETVVSATAPTSIFHFLDALGSRDAGAALRMLSSLLAEGESVTGLHAMSVRHIRRLLSVSALESREDGRHSPAAIAQEVGVPHWKYKNLSHQAGRFAPGELVEALRAAAATEAEMKTSRESRLAFERWVLEVCGTV